VTLVARNALLRVAIALAFIFLAGFVAVAVFIFTGDGLEAAPSFDASPRWLGLTWHTGAHHVYRVLGGLLVQALLSIVALSAMLRMFRKTTAPEVFFFSVFVFTLAIDAVKIGQLFIVLYQYPAVYGAVLTRVLHFGHFLGIFSLLISSLYLSGLEYQKTGVVLGTAALVALTLAYSLPVDFSRLLPSLMHPVGDQTTMQVVAVLLNVLVLVNVLYAIAAVQERAYWVLLLGLALAVAGREAALYVAAPLVHGGGVAAQLAGVWLFAWRIRKLYLWR
jgi:hypothetical protein